MFCDGEGYLNPEGNTAAALVLDNLICKPAQYLPFMAFPAKVLQCAQTAVRSR